MCKLYTKQFGKNETKKILRGAEVEVSAKTEAKIIIPIFHECACLSINM